MSKENNGGPAFPGMEAAMVHISSDGVEDYEMQARGGMSLRQYYAGRFMQGAIAGYMAKGGSDGTVGYWDPKDIASYALECADALIAALDQ